MMEPYLRELRNRVRESRYAIDERAIADAIITRARLRLTAGRGEPPKHQERLEHQI